MHPRSLRADNGNQGTDLANKGTDDGNERTDNTNQGTDNGNKGACCTSADRSLAGRDGAERSRVRTRGIGVVVQDAWFGALERAGDGSARTTAESGRGAHSVNRRRIPVACVCERACMGARLAGDSARWARACDRIGGPGRARRMRRRGVCWGEGDALVCATVCAALGGGRRGRGRAKCAAAATGQAHPMSFGLSVSAAHGCARAEACHNALRRRQARLAAPHCLHLTRLGVPGAAPAAAAERQKRRRSRSSSTHRRHGGAAAAPPACFRGRADGCVWATVCGGDGELGRRSCGSLA